jgi:hypothetical protein
VLTNTHWESAVKKNISLDEAVLQSISLEKPVLTNIYWECAVHFLRQRQCWKHSLGKCCEEIHFLGLGRC